MCAAMQVEPPKGDALRSLRLLDDQGTSLWWRCHVSGETGGLLGIKAPLQCERRGLHGVGATPSLQV